MKRHLWWIIPLVFATNIILQTWLAWDGEQFALLTLAVSSVMLAGFLAVYAKGWRDALEGWGRSTSGWGAAQDWGMKQDLILRDVLKELGEWDEEAAEIHGGRSMNASIDYIKTFGEDTYISAAIKDELRKERT